MGNILTFHRVLGHKLLELGTCSSLCSIPMAQRKKKKANWHLQRILNFVFGPLGVVSRLRSTIVCTMCLHGVGSIEWDRMYIAWRMDHMIWSMIHEGFWMWDSIRLDGCGWIEWPTWWQMCHYLLNLLLKCARTDPRKVLNVFLGPRTKGSSGKTSRRQNEKDLPSWRAPSYQICLHLQFGNLNPEIYWPKSIVPWGFFGVFLEEQSGARLSQRPNKKVRLKLVPRSNESSSLSGIKHKPSCMLNPGD